MASRIDIKRHVEQSLSELAGTQLPEISDSVDPIVNLGLTSEDGVDFACILSRRLGFMLPLDVNPFVDDAKKCSRNLGQIVKLICDIAAERREEEYA